MRIAAASITGLIALINLIELIRGRRMVPLGINRPTGTWLRWDALMGIAIASGSTLMILDRWPYGFFLFLFGCTGAFVVRGIAAVQRRVARSGSPAP